MTNKGIWIQYDLSNKAELIELNNSLYNGKVKWSSNYKEKDIKSLTNRSIVYIYYRLKDNKYIDPRLMVKLDNNTIDLVKGRDKDEDVEYSLSDVLIEKIKEIKYIDQFEKNRVYDYLFDVENYNIVNRKINNNERLDSNDIKRLYTSNVNNVLSDNIGKKLENIKKSRNIIDDYSCLTDTNDKSKFLNYNYKIIPHNSIDDEEVLLKLVNNKPFIIILASKELKKDKEFVKKCAFLNPDSFNYVSSELKKNITFVKELLKREPSILKYTSKSIRSNKELLKILIKENIDFVKYIDSELYSDLEFMKELIKIDNSLSMYASESLLKNQDIAISYIINTKKYNWLSDELKCNKEFILKIVKIDPEVLLIIDDSLKNIEFYKEAVKINSNSIFFIDDELKDNDFLIELVKVNPYIVYYLYKNFNNNIDLLRRLVRVLSDYEKDDDALKNFKKDTSEVLKLELEKFD